MDYFKILYEAACCNDVNRLKNLLEHEYESDNLEDLISKVCMELELNCVHLADDTKLVLDRKLMNLRFFHLPSRSHLTSQELFDRLIFTIRLIHHLNTYEGNDELFIFNLKCIAKQISTLKNLLKSTYDRLPWEEIEFCLLTYIRSFKEQDEITIFSKAILSKLNIVKYLTMFGNCLEKLQDYVLTVKPQELAKLPNMKRDEAVDRIMEICSEFKSLYDDHERLRDIHSLNIMLNYVELVESIQLENILIDYVELEEKHGILIILRALQVIGAHLKNTLGSPKLSQPTISYLLTCFSINTRVILVKLRDRLCDQFRPNGEELLQSQETDFLMGIKSDIEKIGGKIGYILSKFKLQLFRELGEKLLNTHNEEVIKEVVCIMKKLDLHNAFKRNICELNENNRLKNLISQLHSKISQSSYSEFIFDLIDSILKEYLVELPIDYMKASTRFYGQYEKMSMFIEASQHKLNIIKITKLLTKDILNDMSPIIETPKLNIIAELLITIFTLLPKQSENTEVSRLFLQIIHIAKFENRSVSWATVFGRKFSRIEEQEEEIMIDKVSKKPKHENLARLREIFTGITYSEYKKSKNLQAIIEALLLDLIPINCFRSRLLFLEEKFPIIMGLDLRNHLSHNNVIVEVLFDSTAATFLFVEKLLEVEQNEKYIRCCNISHIEENYLSSINILNKKQEMFTALKEDNFEAFSKCLEKGADIRSRDIDMSTCLHFAMNKPETTKLTEFLWKQGLTSELKNSEGQTPLHIAALKGNVEVVEFLLDNFAIEVDNADLMKRTASHFAALGGNEHVLNILLDHHADMTKIDHFFGSPLGYAVLCGKNAVVEVFFKRNLFYKLYHVSNFCTILHIAAEFGATRVVEYLLSKKLMVDTRNLLGATPLFPAALFGHLEIFKTLIHHGADVNSRNAFGQSALHCACQAHMEEIVQELLKCKAEVNITDRPDGNAPIHIVTEQGFASILETLLANNANVNLVTKQGRTPLHNAVEGRHLNVVEILMKQKDIKVNIPDKMGITPLHLAASNGDAEILTLLMKNGARVNCKDLNRSNPLHLAANNGHEAIVNLLIANRISVKARTVNDKLLPLHLAAISGNVNIIKKLINEGSEVNATTANGSNCLHLAIKNDRNIVDMLLLEGVNVEVKTKDYGFTPLHLAILTNNLNMVQSLLKAGSHINAQDHLGNTPVHLAIERNSFEIFSFLVQNSPNITLGNKMGESPIVTAVKHNRIKFVQICLSSGLIDDNLSFKLLETAISEGNINIVKLLLEQTEVNPIIYRDSEENTLLHQAAMFGKPDLVELLLNCGIGVDMKNKHGETPLFLASTKGCGEVSEILLPTGAQTNIQECDGVSPLHVSIQNHPKCVEILLARGANSDEVDKNNRLAVEQAVAVGHLEVIKFFLKINKNHLNRKGYQGCTLLHIAAQFGQIEVIQFLLGENAHMHSENESGSQPVHIAAREGFTDIVDIFIQKGINVDVRGEAGNSLLHYAAFTGKIQVLKFLLKRGCNVNSVNDQGITPLYTAFTRGHAEVAKLLLDNAAIYNINHENKELIEVCTDKKIKDIISSVRKLFSSIRVGNIAKIEESIRRVVPLNCIDINKGSPLHFAVYKGNIEAVKLLLQNKVHTNTPHKNGCTPLHYAVKYSFNKIVLLLLWHGARYDIDSDKGKKPVDFAENGSIRNLLQLIHRLFEGMQKQDLNIFDHLRGIIDEDVWKAVMRAENKHGTILTAAVKKNFSYLRAFQDIFQERIQFKYHQASIFIFLRKYREANEIYLSIYQESRDILGDDNLYTLCIKSLISSLFVELHFYERALKGTAEVYQKLKEILGVDHKHTLKEGRVMARTLYRHGKYEESMKVLKEVYNIQKKSLPPEHEDSLKTIEQMALVLLEMNESKRSRCIFNALFKIKEKKILEFHPHMEITYHIARTFSQQGQYDEALKHLQVVYEARKIKMGRYHSDTLRALEELINILISQKKYAEATEECGILLKCRERCLDLYHSDTLLTHYQMADILMKQCKYFTAHKILEVIDDCTMSMQGTNVDVDVITKLLEIIVERYATIGINDKVDSFVSTMNEAAKRGDIDTVEKLLGTGFDVAGKDDEGRNSLHYAVDGNNLEIVKLLLENNADITEKTNKGNTVLHTACNKGYEGIIELILNNVKANKASYLINAATNIGKMTALHVAAKQGFPKIVRMLLKKGAHYNCLNKDGKTPRDLTQDEDIKNILRLIENTFVALQMGEFSVIPQLHKLEKKDFLCVTNATNIENHRLFNVLILNDEIELGRNLLVTTIKTL